MKLGFMDVLETFQKRLKFYALSRRKLKLILFHLDSNAFHVLGTSAIYLSIQDCSLKSRLGPKTLCGGNDVCVAAEEQGGEGGVQARPLQDMSG